MNKALTITEVMEQLQISRSSVLKLIDKKELPAAKINNSLRFKQADIDRLWERNLK